MVTTLGSGSGILSALGQYHEESGPHGGLTDLAANARDAGALNWRLQGVIMNGTSMIACSDDGPGPCEPGAADPSAEALLQLVRPGVSNSTDDAGKIGQAGIGALSGPLVMGGSVLFATHSPRETHVLLISESFNDMRKKRGELYSCLVVQLSRNKASGRLSIRGGGQAGAPFIATTDTANADVISADTAISAQTAVKLLMEWSPFFSAEAVFNMVEALLPRHSGGLAQLIFDLRHGIGINTCGSSEFDVTLPVSESHAQAYPISARLFLCRTFPKCFNNNRHRAFNIQMGRFGEACTPLVSFDPRHNVHNIAPSHPLLYCYPGEQQPVVRVWMGWMLKESGNSAYSGDARALKQHPYGIVVVYNGQMVTFFEKTACMQQGNDHRTLRERMVTHQLGLIIYVEVESSVNLANPQRDPHRLRLKAQKTTFVRNAAQVRIEL